MTPAAPGPRPGASSGGVGRIAADAKRAREVVAAARTDPELRRELPARVRRNLAHRVPRRRVRTRRALPDVPVPDGPVARPDLTVAVILDPFSELAFRYEWDQLALLPGGRWRVQAGDAAPDLLFVESAWQGNGGAWRLAMSTEDGPSEELRELVAWFRDRGVPTVFWNKEDPPNYDRFLETARLFDHVFTVDAERLPAYRADLGHDRVALLPFAAQPRIHTPVRRGPGRAYDVAFAGTYFAEKHPERRAQMDYLLAGSKDLGLDIYSRLQTDDARYRFPREYRRHIVGSLPYEQMLGAYTSYKVFLNVNSVTGSPTMCSRRLFELSAAETAVVTAPAAAVEPFFGDDLTVVHDTESARLAIGALVGQAELRDRTALRARQRVHREHLYRHRVDAVLRTAGLPVHEPDRSVSAVVPTMRPGQVDHVVDFLGGQAHGDIELVLVTHGFEVDERDLRARAADAGLERVVVVPAAPDLTLGACMNLGVVASSGRYVAKMDDDNSYAANYLADLLAVFDYTEAAVAGKWAHYVHLAASDATLLRFAHAEHRYVDLVQGGTLLTERATVTRTPFEDVPRRVDTTFLENVRRQGGRVYSADRFNFVSRRAATTAGHTWGVTDQELLTRSSDLRFYGDPLHHVTV